MVQRDDRDDAPGVDPVQDVEGAGKPHTAVAHAQGVALKGKTTAHFDGGVFHTEVSNTEQGRAASCAGRRIASTLQVKL